MKPPTSGAAARVVSASDLGTGGDGPLLWGHETPLPLHAR